MFAGRPLKNIGTATGKAPTEKPPSQCCEITPTVPTCVCVWCSDFLKMCSELSYCAVLKSPELTMEML